MDTFVLYVVNSYRNGATLARLLIHEADRLPLVSDAIRHLANDPTIAVRSQAIYALLAMLDTGAQPAIDWFKECVRLDPVLLGTNHVERFVHHAGLRNYVAIQPVLRAMLQSDDDAISETAARQCCVLGLSMEAAADDAGVARTGTVAMRKEAARVYANNVAHSEVGAECRQLLLPFFADPDYQVRKRAARAFQYLPDLDLESQAALLEAFLNAKPSIECLARVVRALEKSFVALPNLVCRLAELAVSEVQASSGDKYSQGGSLGGDLSKLVIRLYTQSNDESIKARCLDLIDEMEFGNFWGLSEELERLER